jgi:hypothetical protein
VARCLTTAALLVAAMAASLRAQADTALQQDSLPADTIKAPLPVFPAPPPIGAGPSFRWNREEIGRSGAFTLDELLARVPGVEAYRTGWLAAPALVAVAGDVSRVRVFLDGIELEGLDPTGGGLLDLSRIQLWSLEEVAVERRRASRLPNDVARRTNHQLDAYGCGDRRSGDQPLSWHVRAALRTRGGAAARRAAVRLLQQHHGIRRWG